MCADWGGVAVVDGALSTEMVCEESGKPYILHMNLKVESY